MFIAPQANRFSINHYDHAITRYMEDTAIEGDPDTNSQLTEIFSSSQNTFFNIDSTNKKHNNNATALKNTTAYESC